MKRQYTEIELDNIIDQCSDEVFYVYAGMIFLMREKVSPYLKIGNFLISQ